MLPTNLNLNTEKTKGCNNKILISKAGMQIGANKEVNKLPPPESHKTEGDSPMKNTVKSDHTVNKHDNSRMLSEEHRDEKLVITLLIVGRK